MKRKVSHCFSQMLGLYVLISLAIKCPSPSAQYLAKQKSHLLHKTLSNFSSPTLTSLYLLDSCSFGVPVTFLELLVLYFMQNIDSLLISHMHVSYIHFEIKNHLNTEWMLALLLYWSGHIRFNRCNPSIKK